MTNERSAVFARINYFYFFLSECGSWSRTKDCERQERLKVRGCEEGGKFYWPKFSVRVVEAETKIENFS